MKEQNEQYRIVFVDDEARILDGLRRITRSRCADWDCHFASRAAEALELLEEGNLTAIVSDLNMPGMTGLEMLRVIRASEKYNALPVVLLTGNGEYKVRQQLIDEGADDVLTKPCDVLELRMRLRNLLELRRLQGSNKAA
ncbi:MAG: response regulator [Fimbriimonadaceae bacterium]|nr:response regulator [Fimbriimonadaceae bacterium]